MVIVTPFQEKKKQRYLLFLLGIAILGIIFTFWYSRYFKREPSSSHVLPPKPPEIKINFEMLKSPILTELQPFENIAPLEEGAGRENPFIPY
jgi:uncharacterized membrane protein YpjA